jgi:2-amino-4-hydroxy-6-hydroxymethyldihydropteridine diphosphokinase
MSGADPAAPAAPAAAAPVAPAGPPVPPRRIVFSLGSNLGDRLANLQAGVDHLLAEPELRPVAVSPVYQTAPVGGPPQPDYLNAVLLADSALDARSLLDRCHAAEQALGRRRTVVWGPRTLDIDLISCDDEVSGDPDLTLPHPRAHERAFVLAPWLDVDPRAYLVGHGLVADLLARTSPTGITRLHGPTLAVVRARE